MLMAIAAATLIAAAPAAAATRYASPNGDGPAASCPRTSPCDLETAVQDASVEAGDVVVVLPGTYVVTVGLYTPDSITIRGLAGKPRPKIFSSTNDPGLCVCADGAVARGLKIIYTGSDAALRVWGGTAERLVADSITDGCSTFGGTIRDSVCWSHGSSGSGVIVSIAGEVQAFLRNVTAVGSGTGGMGIRALTAGAHTVSINAKSVIASGSGNDVVAQAESADSVASVTLDHSNYASEAESGAGTPSVTDPGTGTNQTAEPLFVDAPGGDFHQFLGSPTINAGALDSFSGSRDIDDEPRTMGTDPDIGADEFNPTPPETTITKHPRTRTTHRNAKFAFRSDAAGASFECKLDANTYEACDSPKTYQALDLGKHAFKVRATNEFGKTDPTPAHFAWKIVAG